MFLYRELLLVTGNPIRNSFLKEPISTKIYLTGCWVLPGALWTRTTVKSRQRRHASMDALFQPPVPAIRSEIESTSKKN